MGTFILDDFPQRLSQSVGPRALTGFAVLTGYLLFIRKLRYLRRDRKHAEYPYRTREDFSRMTADHAQEIVRYCMALEFPYLSEKALSFALFKTYGIPTISKLLCQTQQLFKPQYASKRYADTELLIVEFLVSPPTSLRANSAIARMNYLHGKYQNKISNDDLLYTLALFVLEIERWIAMYEWRSLTPMEICAFGTHWKSVGDAMDIKFDDLAHGPNNFKDGVEFFDDIKEWAEAYEKSYMVPNTNNHQLAEETTKILLANTPTFLHPPLKQAVIALLENRLRRAMIYKDPPRIYPVLVKSALHLRKFILRHLFPPRPYYLRYLKVSEAADPKTGRYHMENYQGEPWYIPSTFWNRYSPIGWYRWAIGRSYPDGQRFKSEGYAIFEVGPTKLETQGLRECEETRDRLMAGARGGCPFAFSEKR